MASCDGGVRVYVDGARVIDAWQDQKLPNTRWGDLNVSAGQHTIAVEYYEHGGEASAHVWWKQLGTFAGWEGRYYDNAEFRGGPALVRDDSAIDFDWGEGAPADWMPADNFSAVWTRQLTFAPGYYRFNVRGDAREFHAPALLEMLGIPYTGSRVLAHAISLDKAVTKHIWRDCGLPTAPFQVFRQGDEPLGDRLEFPLFVKPVREGSGMGIDSSSRVTSETEMRERVRWVVNTYRQPALVEGFLPGREYTVGLFGNGPSPRTRSRVDIYGHSGYHLLPVLEIDPTVGVGDGVHNTAAKSYLPGEEGAPLYLCPASIPDDLEPELQRLTIAAFRAIGALDVGRVDFRMGTDDRPYLMQINTLPGLNPIVSDLCIMARAEGFLYSDLINEILCLAIERSSTEGLWPAEPQDELATMHRASVRGA